MNNLKRVGILMAIISLLIIAFSVPVMADAIDDALQGKLYIGQVVMVGNYNYYYMGDGYFICTTLMPTTENYSGGSNAWQCAGLNKYLNNGFINLGNTSQGVGVYADTRVAYVTIPSLSDYENLSGIEKGNSILSSYWLRTPYYDSNIGTSSTQWIWIANNTGVRPFQILSRDGVRPAFKLKSDFSSFAAAAKAAADTAASNASSAATNASTAASNAASAITAANNAKSSADAAASNASTAASNAASSVNMLNGTSNGGKSLAATYDKISNIPSGMTSLPQTDIDKIANAVSYTQRVKDIDANTWNTYNYVKSKAIRVIDGAQFTEIVYTKDSAGSTVTGQTSDGVVIATDAGGGYTKLKGTITGQGEKKADIYNGATLVRSFMFNIIPKPSLVTTATVNFME